MNKGAATGAKSKLDALVKAQEENEIVSLCSSTQNIVNENRQFSLNLVVVGTCLYKI